MQGGRHVVSQRRSALAADELRQAGNALYKQGEWRLAIEQYKQAIDLEPWDERFWLNCAAAYTALEEWHEVIEHAEKAIELRYRLLKAWFRKAWAERQVGTKCESNEERWRWLERAWASCKTGIKLSPKDSQMLALLQQG
eukprot:TRINITY_DN10708_c0_g1_i2.p1 TRINITY_DN10708_c0_g1~~TRINITY_DN10708_c0_g1_i2.p1  ORF type:complete len:140 (+),score=39.23 TRINITY_DN10708_c0_g1_i2:240-659(+)